MQKGKTKNPWTVLALTAVTLGIYFFIGCSLILSKLETLSVSERTKTN